MTRDKIRTSVMLNPKLPVVAQTRLFSRTWNHTQISRAWNSKLVVQALLKPSRKAAQKQLVVRPATNSSNPIRDQRPTHGIQACECCLKCSNGVSNFQVRGESPKHRVQVCECCLKCKHRVQNCQFRIS